MGKPIINPKTGQRIIIDKSQLKKSTDTSTKFRSDNRNIFERTQDKLYSFYQKKKPQLFKDFPITDLPNMPISWLTGHTSSEEGLGMVTPSASFNKEAATKIFNNLLKSKKLNSKQLYRFISKEPERLLNKDELSLLKEELKNKGILEMQKTPNLPYKKVLKEAIFPHGYDTKYKIQAVKDYILNPKNPNYNPEKLKGMVKPSTPTDALFMKLKYNTPRMREFVRRENTLSSSPNRTTTWEYYLGYPQTNNPLYNVSKLSTNKKPVYTLNSNVTKNRLKNRKEENNLIGIFEDYLGNTDNYTPWYIKDSFDINKFPAKTSGFKDATIGHDNFFGTMGGYSLEHKPLPGGRHEFLMSDVWDLHPLQNVYNFPSFMRNKKTGRVRSIFEPLKKIEAGKALGVGKPLDVKSGFIYNPKLGKITKTYQDGGELDKLSKISNKQYKHSENYKKYDQLKTNADLRQWGIDYYNDPSVLRKLYNNITFPEVLPFDEEMTKNVASDIQNNLRTVKENLSSPFPSLRGNSAFYTPRNHEIYYDTSLSREEKKDLFPHEALGHASGAFPMNLKRMESILEGNLANPEDVPSDIKNDFKYYSDPKELYAAIKRAQYKIINEKGYKYNHNFTDEDIQQYLDREDVFDNYFRTIKEDKRNQVVKDLLNQVVYNNQSSNQSFPTENNILPKAQNGLQLNNSTSARGLNSEESFPDIKQWHKDWIEKRQHILTPYLERNAKKNQIGSFYNKISLENALKSTFSSINGAKEQAKKNFEFLGAYFPLSGDIIYDSPVYPDVRVHELSHAKGNASNVLGFLQNNDIKKIVKNRERTKKEAPEYIQNHYKYYTSPEEVSAYLDQWRYLNRINPTKQYSIEEISGIVEKAKQERVNKALMNIFVPGANYQYNKGHSVIEDLFTPKEILNLHNTVVMNDKNVNSLPTDRYETNIYKAQNGGYINKFQDGGKTRKAHVLAEAPPTKYAMNPILEQDNWRNWAMSTYPLINLNSEYAEFKPNVSDTARNRMADEIFNAPLYNKYLEALSSPITERDSTFIKNADIIKNWNKKTNYYADVNVTPTYDNRSQLDSVLNTVASGDDIYILGHSGFKFFNIMNPEIAARLKSVPYENCYLGTCEGSGVIRSDFYDTKNIYGNATGSWYGPVPYGKTPERMMYSLIKDREDNIVSSPQPRFMKFNESTYIEPSSELKKLLNPNEYKNGGKLKNTTIPSKSERFLRQSWAESSWDLKAKSPKGALGPLQIMPNLYKDYVKATGDKTPYSKVTELPHATKVRNWALDDLANSTFIKDKKQTEAVRLAKQYAAYNWGRGNLVNFLNNLKSQGVDIYNSTEWTKKLPKEPKDYLDKILFMGNKEFEKEFKKAKTSHPNRKYFIDPVHKYGGNLMKRYNAGGPIASEASMNNASGMAAAFSGLNSLAQPLLGQDEYGGKTLGSHLLSGVGAGAAAGAGLGVPGMIAGALIGGAAGFFGNKREDRLADEALQRQRASYTSAYANGGKLNIFNSNFYPKTDYLGGAWNSRNMLFSQDNKNFLNMYAMGGNMPTMSRELARGKEVEKEHEPTLNFIKSFYKKKNRFPSLKQVATSIATDHIKDWAKATSKEHPREYSYYKMLVDGKMSDEVSKYAFGGHTHPSDVGLGDLESFRNSMLKADGGQMLTTYDSGGSHNENPYGGIPLGEDALVEQGETRFEDYIFSDRLKAVNALKYGLPKKFTNMTFAKASKNLAKEGSERPYDLISKRGQEMMTKRLMGASEEIRKQKEEEEQMNSLRNNIFQDGGLLDWVMQRDSWEQGNSNLPYNFDNRVQNSLQPISLMSSLPSTPNTIRSLRTPNLLAGSTAPSVLPKGTSSLPTPTIRSNNPNSIQNTSPTLKASNNPIAYGDYSGNNLKNGSDWLRYAPVAYNFLAAASLKKPKNVSLPRISGGLSRLGYTPKYMDETRGLGSINTAYRGALASLNDMSGGNAAANRASILGSIPGYLKGREQLYSSINAANTDQWTKAQQMRSELGLRGAMSDQQMAAYEEDLNAKNLAGYQNNLYGLLGAGAEGLGGIGSENYWGKIAPRIYGYNQRGQFTGKWGGRIRNIKKRK